MSLGAWSFSNPKNRFVTDGFSEASKMMSYLLLYFTSSLNIMKLKQSNRIIKGGQIASITGIACSIYAGLYDEGSLLLGFLGDGCLKWVFTGLLFLLNAFLASLCVSKPSTSLRWSFQILCLWLGMTMFLVPNSLGIAFTGVAYILAIVLVFAGAAGGLQAQLSHTKEQ